MLPFALFPSHTLRPLAYVTNYHLLLHVRSSYVFKLVSLASLNHWVFPRRSLTLWLRTAISTTIAAIYELAHSMHCIHLCLLCSGHCNCFGSAEMTRWRVVDHSGVLKLPCRRRIVAGLWDGTHYDTDIHLNCPQICLAFSGCSIERERCWKFVVGFPYVFEALRFFNCHSFVLALVSHSFVNPWFCSTAICIGVFVSVSSIFTV